MERGVVVGGILISISFLLAVLLNRSAMDAVPERGVIVEARSASHTTVVERPVPARSPVDVSGMMGESSESGGGEIRHEDCPVEDTEYTATSQKLSGNCPP